MLTKSGEIGKASPFSQGYYDNSTDYGKCQVEGGELAVETVVNSEKSEKRYEYKEHRG